MRGKCILLKISRERRDLAVRTDQESDNERLQVTYCIFLVKIISFVTFQEQMFLAAHEAKLLGFLVSL